jgi:hypothetical protein
MTVKKKLPSKRLSVSLPGELYAKLELYLRLFGEGAGANDVMAEALRLCLDADKDFRRIWEEDSARRAAGSVGTASARTPAVTPARAGSAGPLPPGQDQKGSIR